MSPRRSLDERERERERGSGERDWEGKTKKMGGGESGYGVLCALSGEVSSLFPPVFFKEGVLGNQKI